MAKLNTSPADMSSNSKPPIGGFGGRQGHGHGHGRARGVNKKNQKILRELCANL